MSSISEALWWWDISIPGQGASNPAFRIPNGNFGWKSKRVAAEKWRLHREQRSKRGCYQWVHKKILPRNQFWFRKVSLLGILIPKINDRIVWPDDGIIFLFYRESTILWLIIEMMHTKPDLSAEKVRHSIKAGRAMIANVLNDLWNGIFENRQGVAWRAFCALNRIVRGPTLPCFFEIYI